MPVKKIIKILWSYIHSPIDFSGNLLLCCWNTFISGWEGEGKEKAAETLLVIAGYRVLC